MKRTTNMFVFQKYRVFASSLFSQWKKVLLVLVVLGTNTSWSSAQGSKNKIDISSYFAVFQTGEKNLFQTKLPLIYQPNIPALPFYTYTIQIPNQGNYTLQVKFRDSIILDNISFDFSRGLEKKTTTDLFYDTSYFIETFHDTVFFPKKDLQPFMPVIGRDVRLQTFHIYPFKYLTKEKRLLVYTKFQVELVKIGEEGENEIMHPRNFTKSKNFYAIQPSDFQAKYSAIGETGDLLLVYRNTAAELVRKFAHWKEQIGFKTHLLQLDANTIFPEDIKQKIAAYYDSIPDILYLSLVGDFQEIPSYLYKQFLTDDFHSDTYYAFLDGNDFVPELLVGRFSGTELENKLQIEKSKYYESYAYAANYEQNIMLIGSDQGENIGDDNEKDWEHLRYIGNYLSDSVNLIPSEYFDGSQNGLDAAGNPNFQDIKEGIKKGNGFIFYTGHGDFSVMNTGSFFTMHVKQLENYNQMPIVISAACNHGKYIDLDCMAEVFQSATKDNQWTGSVAFAGSTILMPWAPPMETQDEFARLINPTSSAYKGTLGAAFYNAQLSMLEKYPTTYGEEVMQTWMLFGDPALKMRVNQKGTLEATLPDNILETQQELIFFTNEKNCFVSLSLKDTVIATTHSQENKQVYFENLQLKAHDQLEIVVTKPNYRTFSKKINVIQDSGNPFTVFPNPTGSTLNIVGLYWIDFIEIKDVTGRKVSNYTENSKNSYNLEQLSAGIYTILIHANNTIYTSKIQKINAH